MDIGCGKINTIGKVLSKKKIPWTIKNAYDKFRELEAKGIRIEQFKDDRSFADLVRQVKRKEVELSSRK